MQNAIQSPHMHGLELQEEKQSDSKMGKFIKILRLKGPKHLNLKKTVI